MAKVFLHTHWVIEWDNPSDFLFGDLWVDIDTIQPLPYKEIAPYNQYKLKKTASACTIINTYRVACYVADVSPTAQDFVDAVDYAVKLWYKIWSWWYVFKAIDCIRAFMREHHGVHLTSVYSKWSDPTLTKMLKKGYPAVFSYWGNYAYNKDYQPDAELNGSTFGFATYGHCTVQKLKDNVMLVDDSSYGNSYNIYKIDKFAELFQNRVFNPWLYFFIKDLTIDVEKIKRTTQLRGICQQISDLCTTAKPLSDDTVFVAHLDEAKQVMMAKILDCNEVLNPPWLKTIDW